MFCTNCGNQIQGQPKFCPFCGQAQTPSQPTFYQPAQQPEQQPVQQSAQPVTQQPETSFQTEQNAYYSASYNSSYESSYAAPNYYAPQGMSEEVRKSDLAGSILTWGILSLAFSCTSLLSLLGFIFSFTVKSRVGEYLRLYGPLEGRASVGRGLGKAGFIVGLIMTIFWVLYFTLLFFIILIEMM